MMGKFHYGYAHVSVSSIHPLWDAGKYYWETQKLHLHVDRQLAAGTSNQEDEACIIEFMPQCPVTVNLARPIYERSFSLFIDVLFVTVTRSRSFCNCILS